MKQNSIAIIGAGAVGTTTAYALMMRNIVSTIMLVDANEIRCKGEMLDLSDALPFSATSHIIAATLTQARQADIIIIAAGARQKEGQARTELVEINRSIIGSIIAQLAPLDKEAIIIMVSNPVDVLTLHAQQLSQLPHHRIFGSGTFLDSVRLRGMVAEKMGVADESVHINVLGEHGDSQFVAWSGAHIEGTPLSSFESFDTQTKENIASRARQKAYEIISCKEATFYGIAMCIASLCESILLDQKRVVPVSCFSPEYGIYMSLPAVVGKSGVERIIRPPFSGEEQAQFLQSVKAISKLI